MSQLVNVQFLLSHLLNHLLKHQRVVIKVLVQVEKLSQIECDRSGQGKDLDHLQL